VFGLRPRGGVLKQFDAAGPSTRFSEHRAPQKSGIPTGERREKFARSSAVGTIGAQMLVESGCAFPKFVRCHGWERSPASTWAAVVPAKKETAQAMSTSRSTGRMLGTSPEHQMTPY